MKRNSELSLEQLLRKSILEIEAKKLLVSVLPRRFKRYRTRKMIRLLEAVNL